MAKKNICVVSVYPLIQEVQKQIHLTNAPFTAEQWLCSNLAEVKTIPLTSINKVFAQGAFHDLVRELNDSVVLDGVCFDHEIDVRLIGNTLLLTC